MISDLLPAMQNLAVLTTSCPPHRTSRASIVRENSWGIPCTPRVLLGEERPLTSFSLLYPGTQQSTLVAKSTSVLSQCNLPPQPPHLLHQNQRPASFAPISNLPALPATRTTGITFASTPARHRRLWWSLQSMLVTIRRLW